MNKKCASKLFSLSKKTINVFVGVFMIFASWTPIISPINFANANVTENQEDGVYEVDFSNTNGVATAGASPIYSNVTVNTTLEYLTLTGGQTTGYTMLDPIQPASHQGWTEVEVSGSWSTVNDVRVDFYDCTTPTPLLLDDNAGAKYKLSGGKVDIPAGLDAQTCLRPRILLDENIVNQTPLVDNIKITWEPEAFLLLSPMGLDTAPVGSDLTYTFNFSNSYVDSSDTTFYVTLPSDAAGTVINDTGAYAQTVLDPIFDRLTSSSGVGVYTAAATTVNGFAVPANSVYIDMGTVEAGKSLSADLKMTVPNGIQTGVQYDFKARIQGTNASDLGEVTKSTILTSAPVKDLEIETEGVIIISDSVTLTDTNYVYTGGAPYDGIATYALRAGATDFDTGFSSTGVEAVFNPTLTADLSDVFTDMAAAVCPVGTGYPDRVTIDGVTATLSPLYNAGSETLTWTDADLYASESMEPGEEETRVIKIDYNGCPDDPAREYVVSSSFSSDNITTQTETFGVFVGIPVPSEGDGLFFAKGDTVNGYAKIDGGNMDDNASRSTIYGDSYSYRSYVSNNSLADYYDVVISEPIPSETTLLSATATNTNSIIYYSTTVSGTVPAYTVNPGVGFVAGPNWTTVAPVPLSNTTWVASYSLCLDSVYFGGNCGEGVSNNLNVSLQVNDAAPGNECLASSFNSASGLTLDRYTNNPPTNNNIVALTAQYSISDTEASHIGPSLSDLSTSTVTNTDASVGVRDETTYTIKVINTGVDTAFTPIVTVPMPTLNVNGVAGKLAEMTNYSGTDISSVDYSNYPTDIKFTLNDIPAGETKTFDISFLAPIGTHSGQDMTVQAQISASDDQGCGPQTAAPSKSVKVLGFPDLVLTKDRTEQYISSADTIHYQIDFRNVGLVPAEDAFIIDSIPEKTIVEQVFVESTTDDIGKTASCSGCEVYFASAVKGINTLSASDPISSDDIYSDATLGTEVLAGVWEPPTGMDARFIIVKGGDKNLIDDVLPSSRLDRVVRKFLVRLKNDDDGGGIGVAGSADGTILTNTVANVTSNTLQAVATPVTTLVLPNPGLVLDKYGGLNDDQDFASANETFPWVIDYSNSGSGAGANTSTVITDTLPAGYVLDTATHEWNASAVTNGAPAGSTTLYTAAASTDASFVVVNNPDTTTDITFDVDAYRGSGLIYPEGGTLVLNVTVPATAVSGDTETNTANGAFSNILASGSTSSSHTITISNTEIGLTKLVDKTEPLAGETLTYSMILKNDSALDAETVVITDTLPANVCYTAASTLMVTSNWTLPEPTVTGVCGTGETLTWNATMDGPNTAAGILESDTTLLFFYQGVVDVGAVPGDTMTNTAVVTTTTVEDGTLSNTDSTTSTVPYPDLVLTEATLSSVESGSSWDYIISYLNNSRQSETNTYLLQELPDHDADNVTDVTVLSVVPDTGVTVYYHPGPHAGFPIAFTPGGVPGGSWTTTFTDDAAYIALDIGGMSAYETGGATITLQATDTVGPTAIPAGTQLDSSGQIFGDTQTNTANDSASLTTKTPGIDLEVTIEGSTEGGYPGIVPEENLTYTITLQNNGVTDACDVSVVLAEDTNFNYLSPAHNFEYLNLETFGGSPLDAVDDAAGDPILTPTAVTYNSGTNTWTLGSALTNASTNVCMPGSSKVSFQVYGEVDSSTADSTVLTSTATVSHAGAGVDNVSDNNSDTSNVISYLSDVSVTKDGISDLGNVSEVNPGDEITYSIYYANTGNTDANDAIISEIIPNGSCLDIGVATPMSVIAGADREYSTDNGTTWVDWSTTPPADINDGTVDTMDCTVTNVRQSFNVPLPPPPTFDQEDVTSDFDSEGVYVGTEAQQYSNFFRQQTLADTDSVQLSATYNAVKNQYRIDGSNNNVGDLANLAPTGGFNTDGLGKTAAIGDLNSDGQPDFVTIGELSGLGGTNLAGVGFTILTNNNTTSPILSATSWGANVDLHANNSFDDQLSSIASLGSTNAWGWPMLALGSPRDDTDLSNAGSVYVAFIDPTTKKTDIAKTIIITKDTLPVAYGLSSTASDSFGSSVAPAGDFDGDGNQDLFVTSGLGNGDGSNQGEVHLIFLDSSGNPIAPPGGITNWTYDNTTAGMVGIFPTNSRVGYVANGIGASMTSTDLDGNGAQDIIVGQSVSNNTASTHILMLDTDGTISSSSSFGAGTFPGTISVPSNNGAVITATGSFMNKPSAIGDLDGDGNQDISIGQDSGCYVSILYGDGAGGFATPYSIVGGSSAVAQANNGIHESCTSVVASRPVGGVNVGDIFGDGTDDFVVGMSQFEENNDEGAAFLLDMTSSPQYSSTGTFQTKIHAPATLLAWRNFVPSEDIPTNTTMEYEVLDGTCTDTLIAKNVAQYGIIGLGSISNTHTDLCLNVYMDTTDSEVTPTLESWLATYIDAATVPSFSLVVEVLDATLFTEEVNNAVSISTTTPETDTTNNSDDYQFNVINADLEITKSVDKGSETVVNLEATTTLTYTIDYENNGPAIAEKTIITDSLPDRVTGIVATQTAGAASAAFTCATDSNVDADPTDIDQVICNSTGVLGGLGTDVPVAATGTIQIVATMDNTIATFSDGDVLNNTASIDSDTFDTDTTNNSDSASTTVGTLANVYVTKTGPTSAVPDTNITYTISYGNNGNADALTSNIVDSPDAVRIDSIVSATQTSGTAALVCSVTGIVVTCDADGLGTGQTITAGDSGTIDIVAHVTNDFSYVTNSETITNDVVMSTATSESDVSDNADDHDMSAVADAPSVIEGIVFNDLNNDSIYLNSTTDPGVSGIVVSLAGKDVFGNIFVPDSATYATEYEAVLAAMVADGTLPAEAGIEGGDSDGVWESTENNPTGVCSTCVTTSQTTDANGEYTFGTLNAGEYWLYKTHPVTYNKVVSVKGTEGGNDSDGGDVGGDVGFNNADEDRIDEITLSPGVDGTQYLFGVSNGSISGTVYRDLDVSATYNAGDTTFSSVTVSLYKDIDADSTPDAGEIITTDTTDTAGEYDFTSLDLGQQYIVVVSDNASVLTGFVVTAGTPTGDVRTPTVGTPTITGVDFGYDDDGISATPGQIGSMVFHDDGDGTYEALTDAPIQSVEITLTTDADNDGVIDGGETQQTLFTDVNGAYLFTSLVVDQQYIVTVSDGTAVISGGGYTWVDGANDGAENNSQDETGYLVMLTSGQPTNNTADFGYTNTLTTTSSIGNLIFRDWNYDGVYDSANDQTIGNVEVTLYADYDNDGSITAGEPSITTFTDTVGAYSFSTLHDGYNYIVDVTDSIGMLGGLSSTAGVSAGIGDNDAKTDPYSTFTSGPNPLTGATTVIDFGYDDDTAATTGSVGDLVFEDQDNDGVYSPLIDSPISGATINIYDDFNQDGDYDAGIDGLGTNSTTTTDAFGAYSFTGLTVGVGNYYVVQVVNPTPGTHTPTYPAAGVLGANIEVGFELDGTTNENYFDADAGFNDGTVTATGTIGNQVYRDVNANNVYDAGTDYGIPGVEVTVYLDQNGSTVGEPGEPFQTVFTDSLGQYTFTGLGQGLQYVVSVTDSANVLTTTYPTNMFIGGSTDNDGKDSSGYIIASLGATDVTADFGFDDDGTTSVAAEFSDQLFSDTNSDGIFTVGTDKVLSGIEITLYNDIDLDGTIGSSDLTISTQTTDVNGNYTFSGLFSDVQYIMRVTEVDKTLPPPNDNKLTGFSFSPGALSNTDNHSQNYLGYILSSTVATPDITYADFGFIDPAEVLPTGSIGDQVFNDAEFDGLWDGGTNDVALSGVGVRLVMDNDGDNEIDANEQYLDATTDALGQYSFGTLALNTNYIVYITDAFGAGGLLTLPAATAVDSAAQGPGANNDGTGLLEEDADGKQAFDQTVGNDGFSVNLTNGTPAIVGADFGFDDDGVDAFAPAGSDTGPEGNIVYGCLEEDALNYNPFAVQSSGYCEYPDGDNPIDNPIVEIDDIDYITLDGGDPDPGCVESEDEHCVTVEVDYDTDTPVLGPEDGTVEVPVGGPVPYDWLYPGELDISSDYRFETDEFDRCACSYHVFVLQRFLNNSNFDLTRHSENLGYYGKETVCFGELSEKSLKEFQEVYSDEIYSILEKSNPGVFDEATQEYINSILDTYNVSLDDKIAMAEIFHDSEKVKEEVKVYEKEKKKQQQQENFKSLGLDNPKDEDKGLFSKVKNILKGIKKTETDIKISDEPLIWADDSAGTQGDSWLKKIGKKIGKFISNIFN